MPLVFQPGMFLSLPISMNLLFSKIVDQSLCGKFFSLGFPMLPHDWVPNTYSVEGISQTLSFPHMHPVQWHIALCSAQELFVL